MSLFPGLRYDTRLYRVDRRRLSRIGDYNPLAKEVERTQWKKWATPNENIPAYKGFSSTCYTFAMSLQDILQKVSILLHDIGAHQGAHSKADSQ